VDKRLLTPAEVSPLVAMTARSVVRLAKDGRLPATETPDGFRFDAEALAARPKRKCRYCGKERDLEHGFSADSQKRGNKTNTCKACKREREARRKLEGREISPGHVESSRVGQQGMYLENTRMYKEAKKAPRYCEVPGCGAKLAYDRSMRERRCSACENAGRQVPGGEAEEDAA
jgi:hypothetical protein